MRGRSLVLLGLLAAIVAQAQSFPIQVRPGVAVSQSNTGTLPSGTPFPMNSSCPTCSPPNMGGQSSTVSGAVLLTSCLRYAVTLYPGSASCTLNNVGSLQVSYWPIGAPSSFSTTTWPRNQGLDEQLSTQPSNLSAGQPMHFMGHAADGIGVIQVTPNGVTQSGGCTSVFTMIEASQCAS